MKVWSAADADGARGSKRTPGSRVGRVVLAGWVGAVFLGGLSPTTSHGQAQVGPRIQEVIVESDGLGFFAISYQRVKPALTTVHFEVQRSWDLQAWSTTGLRLVSVAPVAETTEQVVFRSTIPMDEQGREFLRLEGRPKMPTTEPYVAMTFDDGPHPVHTLRLLDILRARNIRATFYVVGVNVDWHPHILRRMINEGHEIGNHTMSHPDLKTIPRSEVIVEVESCHDAIVDACAVYPATIRPPYGSVNKQLRNLFMSEFGYPTILWDVDPRDWELPGPQVVADRIVDGAHHEAIILAHDIHEETIDAMPDALDRLLALGYSFVTVTELLELTGG